MTFTGKGKQLKIFISETDQYHHKALYRAIIEMLRREGCSGATAIRGVAGFGTSSVIQTAAILQKPRGGGPSAGVASGGSSDR